MNWWCASVFSKNCCCGNGDINVIKSDDGNVMICFSSIYETAIIALDEDGTLELANSIYNYCKERKR